MLMLCWFYCISFAKFLYFAVAPFLLVYSLFMLKRSLYQERSGLRTAAFIIAFLSFGKICALDLRMLKKEFLCATSEYLREMGCNNAVFTAIDTGGVVLTVIAAIIAVHLHKVFRSAPVKAHVTPEKVGLRFWVNLSLFMIIMMVLWQMAPWVGYLTVGFIPEIFTKLPWQVLAIVNLGLLTISFWQAESCTWEYNLKDKKKTAHANNTWTPKDTLWMSVFIYLITLTLSYVAHDVLS